MFKSILSWLILLIFWQLLALGINNTILVPYPGEVFLTMINQIQDASVWMHILMTFMRIVMAFILSLLFSVVLMMLKRKGGLTLRVIDHLLLVLRIVPTAAIILIALVWLRNSQAVTLITLLVMIPLMVDLLDQQMAYIESKYKDPLALYGSNPMENWLKVLIPLSLPAFLTLCKSAFLLGLKVTISSEVLVSIQQGLGRELQYARFELDMNRLFGSTIWILIIALIVSRFFDALIQKHRY